MRSGSERCAAGEASGAATAGAQAALWGAGGFHPGPGMGGGGLSLVGAAEGSAAAVDAVDSPALPSWGGGRRAAASHERAADGPAAGGAEAGAEAEDLWAHQAGTLLKHHIPIKTDSWDVKAPGFAEVHLVSHSGNSGEGEFAHTLNLTDIHSGWTESRALLGKSEIAVQRALDEIRAALPFQLLGLDADNGSEFINWHLKRWCDGNRIQLTRGRPYKKDDNAHIEQKNWTHVRKLLGWDRYDSSAAVAAINDLYRAELRLWMNLYLPSVKLQTKVRVGSKLRRVYSPAATPLQRALASGQANARRVAALQKLRSRLDPFALSAKIDGKLERIYTLTNRRLSPKPAAARDGNGCGKDARRKSQRTDFPSALANRAKSARFALSHSRGDGEQSYILYVSIARSGLHSQMA